jgi:palmitoyltransferase ZDHHC9/14/18
MNPQDKPKIQTNKKLGKNWEYFAGNTVFCWGGRMQNTRDKPISVLTAFVTIAAAPLFFAQAYVSDIVSA